MTVKARPTKLDEFLPYQLSIASNAASNRIAEVYRNQFDLRIPEWRIMAVLGDADSATQRDLAVRTVMDKVAVNRACRSLEERGLVEREPNATDGRSHHLALTGEGRAMYDRIMPLAREMEQRLFAAFTAEERATFSRMLSRVRERAGELDPDDDFDDPVAG
ncbi:MarR family winged helix-turn-helix transcriptional regulator [Pelagerythrobacter marensis]|uniref:Transcriptional regulator marR/emrR family protein n=1 Tax=Pelagerythrobacter marensis TaxID=543877 RepID=A0A0G3X5J4_9SPHN|nr:MarR family winged helix-turn-helix transcriptional regulator [Pelagerythrobacter marensis]AKM06467.1 Transcriptional regulator marR/emrR family protein [Pelagerythrobacter marensis]